MKASPLLRILSLCACLGIALNPAPAAQLFWDTDGATAGPGTILSGAWGTSAFWSTDTAGALATANTLTTFGDVLYFSAGSTAIASDYTINLNGTQNARQINAQEGNIITFSGGTINLGTSLTTAIGATSSRAGIRVDSTVGTGVVISSNLSINAMQTFDVAASKTLTLNTGTFTRNPGASLNVLSTGTVTSTMTGLNSSALSNNILGAWASFDTAGSMTYATVNGSNQIVGLTYAASPTGGQGTLVSVSTGVSDTTGTINYELSTNGALGTNANFNTLRLTTNGGTKSGNFTANGLLNATAANQAFSGIVTIGASRELVITNSQASTTMTFSGGINESAAGTSSVLFNSTVTGVATATVSAPSTYTGGTTINNTSVVISNSSALGSGPIVIQNGQATNNINTGTYGGDLRLQGGITLTNQITINGSGVNGFGGALRSNTGVNTVSGRISSGDINTVISSDSGSTLNINGGVYLSSAGSYSGIFRTVGGGDINLNSAVTGNATSIGVVGNGTGTLTSPTAKLSVNLANAWAPTTGIVQGVNNQNAYSLVDFNGNSQTVGGLTSQGWNNARNILTNSSATAATLTVNNNGTSSAGQITGNLSLVKSGSAILNINGASSYTGSTTISGGTLNLAYGTAQSSVSGASAVSNLIPATTPLTLSGGGLTVTGRTNGTATSLSGATWGTNNSITVTSTAGLAPGQLITSATAGIPAGAFIVSITNSTSFVISVATTAANTTPTTMTATANSYTTSQTVASTAVTAGANTLTVAANGGTSSVLNTNTITRTGGSLNFVLPSGTQSSTNGIITNTLNASGTGLLGSGTGWATVGGTDWAVNSSNLAGGNIAAYTAYTDVTRFASGTKTIANSATSNVRIIEGTTSSNAAITLAVPSGVTTINTLNHSASGGNGTSTVTVSAGQTLAVNSVLAGTGAGALTFGGAGNLMAATAGGDLMFQNYTSSTLATGLVIVNNTSASTVTVAGTGTGAITFGAASTYSGGTNLAGGFTVLNSNSAGTVGSLTSGPLGTGTLTLAGGQIRSGISSNSTIGNAVSITNDTTFPTTATEKTLTLSGPTDLNGGTRVLSVWIGNTVNTESLNFTNVISNGALTKSGPGRLTLSGANTYSGDTIVNLNQGTLILNNANAVQNSTLDTGASGTQQVTFGLAGTNTYNLGGLKGLDDLAIGANSLSVGSNNQSTIYSAVISGAGALAKVGTGSLTLEGANTYTGDTLVSAGTLALGNVNALQSSTLDTGASGSQAVTFAVTGTNTYNLGGLKGGDDLSIGINRLSVGSNSQSNTYNGVISGTGGLTKVGTGTQTLTGANTYTGATTISAGSLRLGSGGTTGSLSTSSAITNNGNLTVNRSNAVTQGTDFTASAITGTGSFTQAGSGTTTLTATNSYSGGTTVTGGRLLVNNTPTGSGSSVSSGTGAGAVTVNSGATLGGTGSINAGANVVTVNGTLQVGSSSSTSGTDLDLGTTAGGSTILGTSSITSLDIWSVTSPSTITAADSDMLRLFGDVTLGGSLVLNNANNYTGWAAGNTFQLFDWSGLTNSSTMGTFTTVDYSSWNLGPTLSLDTTALYTTGIVTIAVIPEPSRAFLMMIGFAALVSRRRRK
jgi:fibronectin-binding autotransporter adhesin